MKMKNISFFQQHVEKIILAVAVLLAFVILFHFALRPPYSLTMDNRDLRPSEVYGHVKEKADALDAVLREDRDPIERVELVEYRGYFSDRLDDPVTAMTRFNVPFGHGGLPGIDDVERGRTMFALPRIPAVNQVVARASYGALGQAESDELQETLESMVSFTSDARDFRYVSVKATFDMDELIAGYQRSPEDPNYRRLPERWWRSRLAVATVQLQRQVYDPATSAWGETTTIPSLPFPYQYNEDPQQTIDPETERERVEQWIDWIRANQNRIMEAEFVPLGNGAIWLPPDARLATLSMEDHRELQRILSRINTLNTQIATAQRNLDRIDGRETPDTTRRTPRTPTPGMMDEMGPFGPGVAPGTRQPTPRTTPQRQSTDQRQQLIERLQQHQKDLDELELRRDEILGIEDQHHARRRMMPGMMHPGMMDEMMFDPRMPGMDPRQRDATRPRQQPAEEEERLELPIVAHDVTAEPGKTYRYRLVVGILNPLFHQTRVHPEQREQYIDRLVLMPTQEQIDALPWSDPVTVDPQYYFYLKSGSMSARNAQIEVWRIFNGMWHAETFQLSPGDPIGGQATIETPEGQALELAMAVDALLVDLSNLRAGRSAGNTVTSIVYLDENDGNLKRRSVDQDRDDPTLMRLQNERRIMQILMESREDDTRQAGF